MGTTERKIPLSVEFVGLPCSGKTTAATLLVQELNAIGIKAKLVTAWDINEETPSYNRKSSISKAIFQRVMSIAKQPVFAFLLYGYAFSLDQGRIQAARGVHQYLERWKAAERVLRRTSVHVVVFDELLVHGCFSLGVGADISKGGFWVRGMVRYCYSKRPWLFVHMDNSPYTCIARAKSRNGNSSRFNENASISMLNKLHSTAIPYSQLVKRLSQSGWKVVSVKGDAQLDSSLKILKDDVLRKVSEKK